MQAQLWVSVTDLRDEDKNLRLEYEYAYPFIGHETVN
jgi:hypothetical protein